jgi:hypothetical protein
MNKIFASAVLFLLMVLSACAPKSSDPSPTTGIVAKGGRVLGMDTNDAAADFNFTQSFAAAQSIGVSAGTLHLVWNGDEGAGSGSTSGPFTDVGGALASANAYYSTLANPASLSLTIAPIDTGGTFLPSDLGGQTMDNANVITRFNAFADWALGRLPNVQLVSIQIGNEIDAPGGASSATYWSQYKTFITAVASHLHSTRPGVKIGVTVTLYGLLGQSGNGMVARAGIISMLSSIDEIGLTYYPIDNTFTVKDPSVVAADFNSVFALVGTMPVYIQEAGYPSSSSCGGTQANQAAFIDALFAAWDAHASQIPFLSILRLNDYSHSSAVSVATSYGLGGNTAFVAYLETLGLRTYTAPSAFKSAWSNLQNRTRERSWW